MKISLEQKLVELDIFVNISFLLIGSFSLDWCLLGLLRLEVMAKGDEFIGYGGLFVLSAKIILAKNVSTYLTFFKFTINV